MYRVARQKEDGGLGRFGEPGLLVLLSLSSGPKHGYGITADVLEETGMRLGPGTLYGSIPKLVAKGLITALPSEDRRQPYAITAAGRAALESHLATWTRVVTVGRSRLAQP
jgi:DNA-binding PadR family transcriptional regulator